jgi:uncharacterized glyoxalase superfamily protein PhnB
MASKAKRKPVKNALPKKALKKTVKKAAKKPAGKAAAPKPIKASVKAPKKTVRPARKAVQRTAKAAGADKTTGCAPGYQQFTPSLVVRSVADAVRFYTQAFGFKHDFSMPGPDGSTAHVQMTFFGGRIMFSPEGAFGATNRTPATLGIEPAMQAYVYCPDVDALAAQAAAAGAKILMPPADMFWGDRMLHLEDPDGYRWAFATNIRDFDPAMSDPRNPQ